MSNYFVQYGLKLKSINFLSEVIQLTAALKIIFSQQSVHHQNAHFWFNIDK